MTPIQQSIRSHLTSKWRYDAVKGAYFLFENLKIGEFEMTHEKLISDTYLFFLNVLDMNASDSLAAVNRILEKCRLSEIKEPRYHLVFDQRLKDAYRKKFDKTNFKEFYIDYLKTAIKNEK